jgi:hypothetical protein
LVTTVPVAGGVTGVAFAVVGAADVFGAGVLCVDGDCVGDRFVCAKLWVCHCEFAGFDGAFAVTLWCAFLAVFFATTFGCGCEVNALVVGFGGGTWCVISAAGFIPAAMATLADDFESGGCFTVPCKSGFTMICRS